MGNSLGIYKIMANPAAQGLSIGINFAYKSESNGNKFYCHSHVSLTVIDSLKRYV